jgi:hypothetical protein
MLSQGRSYIINAGGLLRYWWVYIPATAAVMLFAISWNLLGDGLNDLLDPTANYDFHRPPFWQRIFRRKGKQVMPASEQPVLASPFPSAGTANVAPAYKMKYSDGTDPLLLAARDDVLNGNLSGALHSYQHLIQRGRMIDELLPDLAQLVQKHPRNPDVWQTLGDALLRSGDSVHAAQAYEQARRLRQQTGASFQSK